MSGSKVGHILAKGLGIKLQKNEPYEEELTRGESVFSVQSGETFVEQRPTTEEFLRGGSPSLSGFRAYVWSLFPFLHWITHYNWIWAVGDIVAGEFLRRHVARASARFCACYLPFCSAHAFLPQASPSVPSSCLRAWRTRCWPTLSPNTVFTRLSWES